MADVTKIAIIGDFNFAYNTHHAVNLALEHAANLLEIELNHYWIKPAEIIGFKKDELQHYDAFWIVSGPYINTFYFYCAINEVLKTEKPVLVTGEGFYHVIDLLVKQYNLNPNQEKVISDNLIAGDKFETVSIVPVGPLGEKMYNAFGRLELTTARYSVYPQLVDSLSNELINIEAKDEFNELQFFTLNNRPNTWVSMFLPQISSTRDLPHPVIYSFIKSALAGV
jgi:CTP synthase (UTP-ammonia lyase)